MIHLHWNLLDLLKIYNEYTDECSMDTKAETAFKIIKLLNEEIEKRKTTVEKVTYNWLLQQVNSGFTLRTSGEVTSVPGMVDTYACFDSKDVLDNLEFLMACNKIIKTMDQRFKKEETNES